jgi:hypothetical protein
MKLKLKCLSKNRNEVVTAIVEHGYLSEMVVNRHVVPNSGAQAVMFAKCQRLTRYNARVDSTLICAPHGIMELDRATGMVLRTYYYKCIRAVCFLGDDVNGIVFYVNETNYSTAVSVRCDCKVWFVESTRVGGSGRGEILTVLKNKFVALGMPLNITESIGLSTVNDIRKSRGEATAVGEWVSKYRVEKYSQRRQSIMHEEQQQQMVDLILTRGGYILELNADAAGDDDCVKSSRSLRDVVCIVRHSISIDENRNGLMEPSNKFTIEFKGGLQRTYSSDQRDTVIVSILDITVYSCKNYDATVTDVSSGSYNMLCYVEEDIKDSPLVSTQNLFQSDPIDLECLKLLHDVSTVTNANIQHLYVVGNDVGTRLFIDETVAVIECCREFNFNVPIRAVKKLPDDKKLIECTIEALWELCLCFLRLAKNERDTNKSALCTEFSNSEDPLLNILPPLFQSLYRLMMTEIGYSTTAENRDMVKCVNIMFNLNNTLALYWFLKCLSALLLPRPFTEERDKRNEFMNKSTLLESRTNITKHLVGGIMRRKLKHRGHDDRNAQVESDCSDLIIMVTSNIIESILCSHRDTTPAQCCSDLIDKIRDQ